MGVLDRSASSDAGSNDPGRGGDEGSPPPLKKARSEPVEDYSLCGAVAKGPSSTSQKVGVTPGVPQYDPG